MEDEDPVYNELQQRLIDLYESHTGQDLPVADVLAIERWTLFLQTNYSAAGDYHDIVRE